MKNEFSIPPLQRVLHILSLIGAVVLVAGLSVEIIAGDRTRFSAWHMTLQLVVCLLFLADLTVLEKIRKSHSQVESTRTQILTILHQLQDELEDVLHKHSRIQKEVDALILSVEL